MVKCLSLPQAKRWGLSQPLVSVFTRMNVIFMVPSSSVLGYTWISFYAFSHPHLLPSPCSQGNSESCSAAPQYPQGLFVWQGLPGAVSPFPCWHSQSWSSDRLGNGHLATGRLLNPAQPCSGQGQPSHPRDLPQLDICPKQWQYHIYWVVEHEPPEAPPMLEWNRFGYIGSTYLYEATNLLLFERRISGKIILSGIREIHTISCGRKHT